MNSLTKSNLTQHCQYDRVRGVNQIFLRSLKRLLMVLPLALLNSCYFNSAGHIFDKASHDVIILSSDIKQGDTIYQQDESYYLELPCRRFDAPVITQYPSSSQDVDVELGKVNESRKVMVKIPTSYAQHLMGQNNGTLPSRVVKSFILTDGLDGIKQQSVQHKVACCPPTDAHVFKYVSPNAAGWYALGALDWLCVDLPVTCAENAVTVAFVGLLIHSEAKKTRRMVAPPPPRR